MTLQGALGACAAVCEAYCAASASQAAPGGTWAPADASLHARAEHAAGHSAPAAAAASLAWQGSSHGHGAANLPWHGHMHGAGLGSSSSNNGQTGMLHMLAAAAASLFGTQGLHGGLPDHTSNMMAGAGAVDHVGYARHLLAESTSTHQQISTTQMAVYIVIVILLVIGSGIMSGLTLGLLSLDMVEMEVLKRSGTPSQRRNAEKIMPVIKDTHLLLVTLLLCNAGCMEALPIFLNALVDEVTAILVSVTAILIFGEILPQSICKRHGLAIGAFLAWPVRILMLLCSPVSWPVGKLLDWLLEHESHNMFRRRELKALVDMHGADEGLGGKLSDDEVQIICGALDLTSKVAYLGMTPLSKVVALSTDDKLDRQTLKMVLDSGHSRLPVYDGHKANIIGLVLTKDLLNYSLEDEVPIRCMRIRPLPRLPANTGMYAMLKLFRTGRSHMAVLTQPDTGGEQDLAGLTDEMRARADRSVNKRRSLSKDRVSLPDASLYRSRSGDQGDVSRGSGHGGGSGFGGSLGLGGGSGRLGYNRSGSLRLLPHAEGEAGGSTGGAGGPEGPRGGGGKEGGGGGGGGAAAEVEGAAAGRVNGLEGGALAAAAAAAAAAGGGEGGQGPGSAKKLRRVGSGADARGVLGRIKREGSRLGREQMMGVKSEKEVLTEARAGDGAGAGAAAAGNGAAAGPGVEEARGEVGQDKRGSRNGSGQLAEVARETEAVAAAKAEGLEARKDVAGAGAGAGAEEGRGKGLAWAWAGAGRKGGAGPVGEGTELEAAAWGPGSLTVVDGASAGSVARAGVDQGLGRAAGPGAGAGAAGAAAGVGEAGAMETGTTMGPGKSGAGAAGPGGSTAPATVEFAAVAAGGGGGRGVVWAESAGPSSEGQGEREGSEEAKGHAPHVTLDIGEPGEIQGEEHSTSVRRHSHSLLSRLTAPLRKASKRRKSSRRHSSSSNRRSSRTSHTSSHGSSSDSDASGRASMRTEAASSAPAANAVPPIAQPGTAIGIITIEDVLEELMGREILMYKELDQRMRATINGSLFKVARRISDRSVASGGGPMALPPTTSGTMQELLQASSAFNTQGVGRNSAGGAAIGGGFVPIGPGISDAMPTLPTPLPPRTSAGLVPIGQRTPKSF